MSVLPACFGRGIGATLLSAGCEKARPYGYQAAFLCGDPSYYSRLGFPPTHRYGIYHVNNTEKNAQWRMVKELTPGFLARTAGTVDFDNGYELIPLMRLGANSGVEFNTAKNNIVQAADTAEKAGFNQ